MKIFLQPPSAGLRFPLEVEASDTVENVLARIEDKGFDPNAFKLMYKGKLLANEATCASECIIKEATLHLVKRSQAVLPTKALECDSVIKASIIDFYSVSHYHTYKPPSFCSIEDILKYGVMESVEQKGAPAFRWIHLPSNNMSWVERLIDAIYVEQGLKKPQKEVDSEDERSTANKGKRTAKVVDTPEPGDNEMATQLLLRPHYWARQQFVSRKSQGDVQSRFMKPCFSRISNAPDSLGMQLITPSQDQRSNSFVFMPFIDWELISMQTERKRCLRKLAKEPALRFWPRLPWPIQYPEWRELPIGAKLLIAYSQVEPPIHDRRTLDQAFYYTMNIENAWKRDTDQVLYRYFQTTNEPEEARILMADQLWIWIVDTPQKRDGEPESRLKTVVTAFPPRWSKKEAEDDTEGNEALLENARSVPDAHGRILSALYSDYSRNISSVTDLLCLIIDKCPALFHPLPEEVNDPLDYLDVFATEIGEQASQETDLADSMWEHSEKLQKHLDHKKDLLAQSTRKLFSRDGDRTLLSRVDNDIDKEMGLLSDITQETKCLKVVKDIMDELNGISYIFTQQMNVVRSMVDDAELQQNNVNDGRSHRRGDPDTDDAKSSKKGDVDRPPEEHSKDEESSTKTSDDNPPEGHYEDTPEDMELKYKRLLSTLKKRKETITHLKDEAYRVYRDLCDLLDLKQKQATVFQAVLASQESREAERQGQTIMLFTIVTVIFVSVERTTHARGFGVQDVPDVIPLTVPLTIVILIISLLLAYSKLIKRLIIFVFGNGVDEQPAEGNDGHGGDGHVLVDLAPAIAARPAAQATAKNGRPLQKTPRRPGESAFTSVLSRRWGARQVSDSDSELA